MTQLITGLLLLTGATGLIYQVVIGRLFALYLGSSGASHAVTLAAFLGGLSLGALLLERIGPRLRRPFVAYAALEAGVGLWMLLFPTLADWVFGAVGSLSSGVDPTSTTATLLKLGAAAVLVLPLSTLLGATLPALAQGIARRYPADAVPILSRFYAVNAGGAALGAWAAGFWLIEAFGLDLPLLMAATVNLVVGALVYAKTRGEALGPPAEVAPAAGAGGLPIGLAVVAAGATGFVALLYEIVWTRLAALVLGASVYAFSMMLVVVILGIAVGSALATRLCRRHPPALVFALSQTLATVSALWLVSRLDALPAGAFELRAHFAPRLQTYDLWVVTGGGYLMAHFLPCAIGLGAAFPALLAAAHRSGAGAGRATSLILGVNTLGNLGGALIGSFALMPALGLEWVLTLGGVASGLLALAAAARYPRTLAGVVAVTAAAGIGLGTHFPAMNLLYQGLFRIPPRTDVPDLRAAAQRYAGTILFREDGTDASITIHQDGHIRSFRTNGKADGSVAPRGGGDQITQLLLGHLGYVHVPEAKSVFVVGFGTGQSVAAAASHPGTQVTAVELNAGVLEAAPLFRDVVGDVLARPNVKVLLTDGREALRALPDGALDLYVSEPSNPWLAGVADLFTAENFQRVQRKLAPHGAVVQWFHAYELGDEVVHDVLCTVHSVFPAVWVYRLGVGDFALIARNDPTPPPLEATARWLNDPAVRATWPKDNAVLPETLDQLVALNMAAPAAVDALCAGFDTPLAERFPRLEYLAPRFVFARQNARAMVDALDARLRPPFETLARTLLPGPDGAAPVVASDREALRAFLAAGQYDFEVPLVLALTPPEQHPPGVRRLSASVPPDDAPPEVWAAFCGDLQHTAPWLIPRGNTVLGPAVPALAPAAQRCGGANASGAEPTHGEATHGD